MNILSRNREAVGKIPIVLRERALKNLTSTESLKSNKRSSSRRARLYMANDQVNGNLL